MDRPSRLGPMAWLLMEEAMSNSKKIASALAEALPAKADVRDELIALGLVATGVICQTPMEGRAVLVDTFCRLVRQGTTVASDLN